jgi:hypothetical protein
MAQKMGPGIKLWLETALKANAGVATEGHPYNRPALHELSSLFVGVALRGHPTFEDFCAKGANGGGRAHVAEPWLQPGYGRSRRVC